MTQNEAGKKIIADLRVVMDTPLPPALHDTFRRFIEIISVLQGQIEGLADRIVEHEIEIVLLKKTLSDHHGRFFNG